MIRLFFILCAGVWLAAPTFAVDVAEAARALRRQDPEGAALPGHDGWLFAGDELDHLGAGALDTATLPAASRAPSPESADAGAAIQALHRDLQECGIQLIVVPVPAKGAIYPEGLEAEAPTGAGALSDFYQDLTDAGVEVLDLTADFRAARQETQWFCRQDSHWSPAAVEFAAAAVARRIAAADWYEKPPRSPYQANAETFTFIGDLARALERNESETLPLRRISGHTASSRSPVLILGDSCTLVYHDGGDLLTTAAGFSDQLAYELGMPVDMIAGRGAGPAMTRIRLARYARLEPDWLAGKRVVVWCFAARELTENPGGWPPVQIIHWNHKERL